MDASRKHVLIAGGGVAALEAALALREVAADRVDVELLAPEAHFWYRPLAVAAPFELGEVNRFELEGLARECGASFTRGALTGIDAWRHVAHTSKNTQIPYDVLLVACGALPFPAIPGALMFHGPSDVDVVSQVLGGIAAGDVHSVAFVIPWGSVWPLPAYELALLTASHARTSDAGEIALTLVTPEGEPLELFGAPAITAVRSLLQEYGVRLRTGVRAVAFADGELDLGPNEPVSVDRVVALPRLQGAPIDGLPQTVHGFIPIDPHCHVIGVDDVFAAGDITTFPVKQGGIAAQQADAAAAAIAAATGASLVPPAFRPVLHGLLLTGREPRYLRRELDDIPEHEPVASYEPLWWPPAKVVGRHLAPFLASLTDAEPSTLPDESVPGAVPLEVQLEGDALEKARSHQRAVVHDLEDEGSGEVVGLMAPEPVVVAPEDTLGEVAEHLLAHHAKAAVVADYGRVIGIVTAGDLLRAGGMRVHPSEGRVRQWMTAEPVTVTPRTSVADAARLAREYDVHYLPVVDGGHPVGLLDADDALLQAEASIGLGF